MNTKQIVIFANERVGYETVRRLIQAGYPIRAVFTSHEIRRRVIADYADFEPLSREYSHIPFHFILDPKEPLVIEKVGAYHPDLILVISWSQIIPNKMLAIPPLGTIGVHYSMLPKRRGGAPLTWALIDGLSQTGITLFYYDEGIDSGDIIDQETLEIEDSDTIKTLLDKIMIQLPGLVLRNLKAILEGTNPRSPQDPSQATLTPARRPQDGEIDWGQTDRQIYNFIRAQTVPYPCAFSRLADVKGCKKKLVIPKARFESGRLMIEGYIEEIDP